jgi:hypothetical protein
VNLELAFGHVVVQAGLGGAIRGDRPVLILVALSGIMSAWRPIAQRDHDTNSL